MIHSQEDAFPIFLYARLGIFSPDFNQVEKFYGHPQITFYVASKNY